MEILWIHFLREIFLYLLVLIFILTIFIFYLKNKRESIKIYFFEDLKKIYKRQSVYFYIQLSLILAIISIYFIIFARPTLINTKEIIKQNSIDIVFVLDVSKSMDADDLNPSRIDVAKNMILKFLNKTKQDRIWLVVFAWKPFISTPLSFDYDIIKEHISYINTKSFEQSIEIINWTSTWDALLIAKTLFVNTDKLREKIIVLITDWDANKGIDPKIVAKKLKQENIKIYALWIWTEKGWFIDIWTDLFKEKMKVSPIDDNSLIELTKITSWQYYKVINNTSFENLFNKLQSLNKRDIEIKKSKIFVEKSNIFVYILIILLFNLFSLEYFLIKK